MHLGALAMTLALAYLGLDRQGAVRTPVTGPIHDVRDKIQGLLRKSGVIDSSGNVRLSERMRMMREFILLFYFARNVRPDYPSMRVMKKIQVFIGVECYIFPIVVLERKVDKYFIAAWAAGAAAIFIAMVSGPIFHLPAGWLGAGMTVQVAFWAFLALTVFVVLSSLTYAWLGGWIAARGGEWYQTFLARIEEEGELEHQSLMDRLRMPLGIRSRCPKGYQTGAQAESCANRVLMGIRRFCSQSGKGCLWA
jgi:hypothetical protein